MAATHSTRDPLSSGLKAQWAAQGLDTSLILDHPTRSTGLYGLYGLRPSMSGKGNCYDNASVETFFKTIKAELIWRQNWPTRRQAEAAIFQYINGFYSARWRTSYLGGLSPVAFEVKVA